MEYSLGFAPSRRTGPSQAAFLSGTQTASWVSGIWVQPAELRARWLMGGCGANLLHHAACREESLQRTEGTSAPGGRPEVTGSAAAQNQGTVGQLHV